MRLIDWAQANLALTTVDGDPKIGMIGESYGGGVQFGLVTDKRLCPEPQRIIDRCAPEFAKLLWVTMMLPWGEQLEGLPPPGATAAKAGAGRAGRQRRGPSDATAAPAR